MSIPVIAGATFAVTTAGATAPAVTMIIDIGRGDTARRRRWIVDRPRRVRRLTAGRRRWIIDRPRRARRLTARRRCAADLDLIRPGGRSRRTSGCRWIKERTLLRRLRAADERVFARLVKEHQRVMLAIARSCLIAAGSVSGRRCSAPWHRP